MLKTSFLYLLLLVTSLNSLSQGRMVINDDAFVVMNGGTTVTPAYIVLDNPVNNALSITGTGGNLVSENEFNILRWNIAASTGIYNIPFYSTTGNVKIPFIIQKTTAGAGGSNIDFSTYPTNNNNIPWPSMVTHLNSAQTGVDNSLNVIDRFWMIRANSYTTRPDFDMTFNYDVNETGGSNTVVPGGMVAQRFNSTANTWNGSVSNSSLYFGVDNSAQTRVENAAGPGTELWEAWTLVNNTALLPVELVSFELNCEQDNVLVTWETASENNTTYFEIERSFDGLNYEVVKTITAAGNSNQNQQYSWVDTHGSGNDVYYRITSVDNDGKRLPLQPKSISGCGNGNDIQVIDFNNGDMEVIFNSKVNNRYEISLFDMGGKKIGNPHFLEVEKGKTSHSLSYPFIANGMYLLYIESNNSSHKQKIIVQK